MKEKVAIIDDGGVSQDLLDEYAPNEMQRMKMAFYHLLRGLITAGCSVKEFEIWEDAHTHDRSVKVFFKSGAKKEVDITADSIPMAMFDVMKLRELQERG